MANRPTNEKQEMEFNQKLNMLDAILASIQEAVNTVGRKEVELTILGKSDYKQTQKGNPTGSETYDKLRRNLNGDLEKVGTVNEFQAIQEAAVGITPAELYDEWFLNQDVEMDEENYDYGGENFTAAEVMAAAKNMEELNKWNENHTQREPEPEEPAAEAAVDVDKQGETK